MTNLQTEDIETYKYQKTDDNGNRHYTWVNPAGSRYNFGHNRTCVISPDQTRINIVTKGTYSDIINIYDINPPELPKEESYIMY